MVVSCLAYTEVTKLVPSIHRGDKYFIEINKKIEGAVPQNFWNLKNIPAFISCIFTGSKEGNPLEMSADIILME